MQTTLEPNYVQHFRLAILSVFDCVTDGHIDSRPSVNMDLAMPTGEITCVVGLTGRRTGCMVIEMTRECAVNLTASFLKTVRTDLDESVVDVIGSFANMIAGMVIYNLRELQLSAAVPTVICGGTPSLPSGIPTVTIPFECDLGDFCLTYGWVD